MARIPLMPDISSPPSLRVHNDQFMTPSKFTNTIGLSIPYIIRPSHPLKTKDAMAAPSWPPQPQIDVPECEIAKAMLGIEAIGMRQGYQECIQSLFVCLPQAPPHHEGTQSCSLGFWNDEQPVEICAASSGSAIDARNRILQRLLQSSVVLAAR